MRCPSCGREVSDERFCEWCGKALKTESPSPDKPESVTPPVSQPSSPVHEPSPSVGIKGTPKPASNSPRWHGIGWAALAIVLYLVIADAAVETCLRDSPLRWWIAGAAALYLALCVTAWRFMPKLWRRLDWASQAALSLILLLTLLSVTAWMPGGLEQGISILGQPTSSLLAGVSAIAVALSAIFLVRLHFIPRAGKIVASLLACYGIFAFVFAIAAAVPYASLFHGQSEWTRLPFWLQGATIGGLFVVPLALLLEIVTGLSRMTRAKILEFSFKVLALGMSLVITVAAVRTPEGYVADHAIAPPPWLSKASDEKIPQGEAGYKVVSERLNRMYAALDVVNSKIDRSLFEIDALADRLGSDPTTIFHFVRDEIRYEPYVGVLRGPLGTLLCRAGNSLDRSLLLAALLQKAGLTTQIASGSLNPQQAQTLVNRLFEPVKPVPQAVPSISELAPEISQAMGVDKAKLLQLADQMQKYGQQQNKQLMDYVDSESAYLSDLLSKAGVDAGVVTPNDQLLAEASQHYWVQYQNASGQWIDLDSAFTDAEPGKANTQVTNTFAPDAVPEELYHHLRITLTLRVMQINDGKDGDTTDTALLDQELRVAEQQGKDIIVANVPDPMPDFMKATGTLADALVGTKGFQTVLQVGDKPTAGKYFDLNGKLTQRLTGAPEAEVANNAGGIGGAFGGLTGGSNDALGGATQMSSSRIVGEWVEYKLSSPVASGGSPEIRSFHRDIVAPSLVQSWSPSDPNNPQTTPVKLGKDALRQRLLWCAELLPVTGAIAVDYPGYLTLKSFSQNRAAVDALAKTTFGGSSSGNQANPSDRPPTTNLLLAEGATQLSSGLGQSRLKSYFGRPGLVSYESAAVGSDQTHLKRGYDIVSFAPRIAAGAEHTQGGDPQAAALRVANGVLATRMEWMLVGRADARHANRIASLSASQVLEAARKQGIHEIVLRQRDEAKDLSNAAISAPIKAEVSEALAAGEIVIMPSRPVLVDGQQQIAWWRLRPEGGDLTGILPGGRGGDFVEYVASTWPVFSVLYCAVDYHLKDEKDKDIWGFFKATGCVVVGVSFGMFGWAYELEGGAFTICDILSAVFFKAVG
jgi:hypothetical protein